MSTSSKPHKTEAGDRVCHPAGNACHILMLEGARCERPRDHDGPCRLHPEHIGCYDEGAYAHLPVPVPCWATGCAVMTQRHNRLCSVECVARMGRLRRADPVAWLEAQHPDRIVDAGVRMPVEGWLIVWRAYAEVLETLYRQDVIDRAVEPSAVAPSKAAGMSTVNRAQHWLDEAATVERWVATTPAAYEARRKAARRVANDAGNPILRRACEMAGEERVAVLLARVQSVAGEPSAAAAPAPAPVVAWEPCPRPDKNQYPTAQDAQVFIDRKTAGWPGRRYLQVYPCVCGFFHVGNAEHRWREQTA